MSSNQVSLERVGDAVETLGTQLSGRLLLVIIILGLAIVGLVLIKYRKDGNAMLGHSLKAIASVSSLIVSFSLLLPFVARSLWGTIGKALNDEPSCWNAMGSSCHAPTSDFVDSIVQTTVPATELLGAAALSAFVASLVWFMVQMQDTFWSSK